ncbi:hypothetical protein [Clostridium sp. BJN0013]|uniref:hypothetical protein n=1 Tax=Clostridium sp. BJN0013 TaxID=3236840 RepID=UPI0034C661F5
MENSSILVKKYNSTIEMLTKGHKDILDTINKNYALHDNALKNISSISDKGEKAYNFIKELSNNTLG